MGAQKKTKKREQSKSKRRIATRLKVGDAVMVLGGGNGKKQRLFRGRVGKILRIFPKADRVVVEGVNMVKRHRRAKTARETSGVIEREGTVHISNVMYYSQDHKRPVKLTVHTDTKGRKVRGFINPKTEKFEQIDV